MATKKPYSEMTAKQKKEYRGKFIAPVIVITVLSLLFSFMHTMTTSNNPDNYDTFVIVKQHDKGDDPSEDWYFAHSYGVWFKVFGPSHVTKIRDTLDHSKQRTLVDLRSILRDREEEYTIIEIVTREELVQ